MRFRFVEAPEEEGEDIVGGRRIKVVDPTMVQRGFLVEKSSGAWFLGCSMSRTGLRKMQGRFNATTCSCQLAQIAEHSFHSVPQHKETGFSSMINKASAPRCRLRCWTSIKHCKVQTGQIHTLHVRTSSSAIRHSPQSPEPHAQFFHEADIVLGTLPRAIGFGYPGTLLNDVSTLNKKTPTGLLDGGLLLCYGHNTVTVWPPLSVPPNTRSL